MPCIAAPPITAAREQEVALRFYRFILRLALPVLAGHTLLQRLRGQMPPGALAQRLGMGGTGPVDLWLHGASNGELTSARWLIAALLAARPGLRLVITANSASGRAMVAGWGLPGVAARLAPFDTPGAVRRFRRGWRPRALVVLENELWPERIAQMAPRVALVGARMSAGSARNWARLAPGLMAETLGRLAVVSAQNAETETRLVGLGLPPGRLAPRLMLKAQQAAPGTAPGAPADAPAPRDRVLLAASTHPGEEAVVLAAYARQTQFTHLILAPRHPRRAPEIAAAVRASGLGLAIRSAGQAPGAAPVYLADTMGEMALWYGMAGATLVGGSFGDAGGHTPYEPAAHGSAILHGPGVANFAESYARLDAGGGAVAVADAAALAAALQALDAPAQAAMAQTARSLLQDAGDDRAAALVALLAALPDAPQG